MKDDAISREAAIAAIVDHSDNLEQDTYMNIVSAIRALPPVEAALPLRGEREIAEAIRVGFYRALGWSERDPESDRKRQVAWAEGWIGAARAVIERGIAYSPEQVERMAQALHARRETLGMDVGPRTCSECESDIDAILKAGRE